MSNTHSSQIISDKNQAAVRQLVAERAGREWCLFLDRDGVINRQIIGDYVRTWRQFQWLPNAVAALRRLGDWAPHVVVVTNQQGIGKGLMSADAADEIHRNLLAKLSAEGVAIDAVQVCPHLQSASCYCRKPNPALALAWLRQHPDNEATLSIMAGDSWSDLEFARNIASATGGCASVQIGRADLGGIADASFGSLWEFALAVDDARKARGS